jgi:nitroreductase
MDVYDAIFSRRSIRRFQQKPIPIKILKKFVDAARVAPSAANLQPLEYFIVNKPDLCSKVFETLGWAAYIKPKWIPSENESPVAYIVVLVKNSNPYVLRDSGLASENIVLAAESEGIGSCILCNVNREKLQKNLDIPSSVQVDSVIALGYKAEKTVIENFKGSVEYWRDEEEVLHVPKRKLKDIVHINKF